MFVSWWSVTTEAGFNLQARPRATSIIAAPGWSTRQSLGVEEFEHLLVDFHILPEGDGRGLRPSHEMAPAPWLTGSIKLFHHRLMVLKGMHFGEVVVADDLGQTRNEGGRVVATVDILLGELHRDFDFRHRPHLSEIGHGGPVNRRLLIDTLTNGIQQFILRPI